MTNTEEQEIKYPDTRALVVLINEKPVQLPVGLGAITLGQMIDFRKQYGEALHDQLNAIREMPEGEDQQLAYSLWQLDRMMKEVAFFAGIPLEELEGAGIDDQIADLYAKSMFGLLDDTY